MTSELGGVKFIVCGLGNPGKKYERTRHNAGFLAADELAKMLGTDMKKLCFHAATGEVAVRGGRIVIAKPMTFMNESGLSVSKLARHYEVPPESVIVICDDADMPKGSVKLKTRGSGGSHNGLLSVEESLDSREFVRIKIGTGRRKGTPLSEYVTQELSQDEFEELKTHAKEAAEKAAAFMEQKLREEEEKHAI